MKFPRQCDRTRSGRVARGIVSLGALAALTACGRGKPDPCAGAVRHLFELVGAGAAKDEKQVIDAVAGATLAKCQQEGLSQPQAGDGHACSVARDGKVSCWGKGAVDPPSDRFISLSCAGAQCCGITAQHGLACWGPPDQLREPPAGTFDSVAVFDDHTCAVRAGGGTECWGNNDDGQCNVPQDAASHWY